MEQGDASMPRKCLVPGLSEAAAHLAHGSTDAMCQASCLSGENLASQQEGGGVGAKLDKERGQVIDELQRNIGLVKQMYALGRCQRHSCRVWQLAEGVSS